MKDRNAIKAGLFILITVGLIVGVVVLISGYDRFLEPNQQFVSEFKLADDLGGLKVGDDIRIGGTKVGEVEYIKIDPDHDITVAPMQSPTMAAALASHAIDGFSVSQPWTTSAYRGTVMRSPICLQ